MFNQVYIHVEVGKTPLKEPFETKSQNLCVTVPQDFIISNEDLKTIADGLCTEKMVVRCWFTGKDTMTEHEYRGVWDSGRKSSNLEELRSLLQTDVKYIFDKLF